MKWLDRLFAVLFVGWLIMTPDGFAQLGAAFVGLLRWLAKLA